MHNTLVVDLEATCAADMSSWEMEVIEIGAVWVAPNGTLLDRFQALVRPIINPALTPFCIELTGITQHDVDAAPTFPEVAAALRGFVASHQQPGSTWASWGAWDRKQLDQESMRHGIAPPIDLPHINVKRRFAKVQRLGKEVGMAKACEFAGLAIEGVRHRGLDDSINIARLLPWALGERLLRD